jgi:uncharacterized OsmC-like protein
MAGRGIAVLRFDFTGLGNSDGDFANTNFSSKFLRGLFTASHQAMSDEPTAIGGKDMGPSPYDLLLMALGACTSMTLRMYANHKGLSLDDIQIRLRHGRAYAEDCAECETADRKIERITRALTLAGDLTDAERERLLQIADRYPVHRTLQSEPQIVTTLESSTA